MLVQVIVFTGGGTGGHVYPGLAVLQALRSSLGQAPVRLVWIGSKDGIERGIVTGLGLEYHAVPTGKLRRYWSWKNVADAFRIVAGYLASRVLLRRLAPVFVFSKGGFVSVPPVRAAASLGIPVYSHESDFDPGLATRLNLRASRLVFCAYAESVAQFPPRHAPVWSSAAIRSALRCRGATPPGCASGRACRPVCRSCWCWAAASGPARSTS